MRAVDLGVDVDVGVDVLVLSFGFSRWAPRGQTRQDPETCPGPRRLVLSFGTTRVRQVAWSWYDEQASRVIDAKARKCYVSDTFHSWLQQHRGVLGLLDAP